MRVLIVKLAAIGDVIMALAMLTAIKNKYGNDTHITWLCGITVYPLLKEIDLIDELLVIDERKLFSKSKHTQIKELLLANFKTAFRRYDKTIIANSDKRYGLLVALVLGKKTSFASCANRALPSGARFHGVDYVELATSEAYISSLSYPKLQAPTNAKRAQKTALLFPGGAKNTLCEQSLRRWPIENYAQLARLLIQNEFDVIIAGAQSDNWIISYFKDLNVINNVGTNSLLQTIWLINECHVVVTHDSGPLHMAALLTHTKVVALFGPTLASSRINPFTTNVEALQPVSFACAPCYDGKEFAKCDNNVCMSAISVQDVFERIMQDNIKPY